MWTGWRDVWGREGVSTSHLVLWKCEHCLGQPLHTIIIVCLSYFYCSLSAPLEMPFDVPAVPIWVCPHSSQENKLSYLLDSSIQTSRVKLQSILFCWLLYYYCVHKSWIESKIQWIKSSNTWELFFLQYKDGIVKREVVLIQVSLTEIWQSAHCHQLKSQWLQSLLPQLPHSLLPAIPLI